MRERREVLRSRFVLRGGLDLREEKVIVTMKKCRRGRVLAAGVGAPTLWVIRPGAAGVRELRDPNFEDDGKS